MITFNEVIADLRATYGGCANPGVINCYAGCHFRNPEFIRRLCEAARIEYTANIHAAFFQESSVELVDVETYEMWRVYIWNGNEALAD